MLIGTIEVFTITGEKVLSQIVNSIQQTSIDLTMQPSGMYIIKANLPEKEWIQRVVKN